MTAEFELTGVGRLTTSTGFSTTILHFRDSYLNNFVLDFQHFPPRFVHFYHVIEITRDFVIVCFLKHVSGHMALCVLIKYINIFGLFAKPISRSGCVAPDLAGGGLSSLNQASFRPPASWSP